MSPAKYHKGDIVWYLEMDTDYDPTGWIRECEVVCDKEPFCFGGSYMVTEKIYSIPCPFRVREDQLFKTAKAAHTHLMKWAKRIHDSELAWLTKHKDKE